MTPEHTQELVAAGEAIKKAINAHMPSVHPIEEDLSFICGVGEDKILSLPLCCSASDAKRVDSQVGTMVFSYVVCFL